MSHDYSMRNQLCRLLYAVALCAMVVASFPAKAFCLLGPCAPWMTDDLGYRRNGQIGGPMHINEEYRWHYPVLTYGFDQAFLDAFGDEGVRAVEEAFQILNDLPPASEMVLSNYPVDIIDCNWRANWMKLRDMKSHVLSCLIEQMGLTSPKHSMFCIRERHTGDVGIQTGVSCVVLVRNWDPYEFHQSCYVHATLFGCYVDTWFGLTTNSIAIAYPFDPSEPYYTTAAVQYFEDGAFYTGLSLDDAAGLRYLLNKTNINTEVLNDSVSAFSSVSNDLVRIAPRPGIEKISFIRHATNSTGMFTAMTNDFTDVYFNGGVLVTREQQLTAYVYYEGDYFNSYSGLVPEIHFMNGIAATQQVQRVVSRPDILFSAEETGLSMEWHDGLPYYFSFQGSIQKSGTERWTNCAALNGSYFGDGPGVIQGQVKITLPSFGRMTSIVGGADALISRSDVLGWNWGRFGNDTNRPVVIGSKTNETSLTIGSGILTTNGIRQLRWDVFGRLNGHYRVDASPVPDGGWTETCRITNTAGWFRFEHPLGESNVFFRVVLEN